MIKRKPLPKDQSNMYVYSQDVVNKWIVEALAEKKKEEIVKKKHIDTIKKKSAKSRDTFDRLYMNEDSNVKDFKVNEND